MGHDALADRYERRAAPDTGERQADQTGPTDGRAIVQPDARRREISAQIVGPVGRLQAAFVFAGVVLGRGQPALHAVPPAIADAAGQLSRLRRRHRRRRVGARPSRYGERSDGQDGQRQQTCTTAAFAWVECRVWVRGGIAAIGRPAPTINTVCPLACVHLQCPPSAFHDKGGVPRFCSACSQKSPAKSVPIPRHTRGPACWGVQGLVGAGRALAHGGCGGADTPKSGIIAQSGRWPVRPPRGRGARAR